MTVELVRPSASLRPSGYTDGTVMGAAKAYDGIDTGFYSADFQINPPNGSNQYAALEYYGFTNRVNIWSTSVLRIDGYYGSSPWSGYLFMNTYYSLDGGSTWTTAQFTMNTNGITQTLSLSITIPADQILANLRVKFEMTASPYAAGLNAFYQINEMWVEGDFVPFIPGISSFFQFF